jgi:hypothetical protein
MRHSPHAPDLTTLANIMNLSLYTFLKSSVTSFLLNLNTVLWKLFYTFNLCIPFHVGAQVSCPFKTTGKVIGLSILVFRISDRTQVNKWFQTEYQ